MKRFCDILMSTILIVVLLPIMILFSFLIIMFDKHSPIFIQSRPGLNGILFKLYKFQTMSPIDDSQNIFLTDEIRLTRLGKFLRSASLDELPTLWNVIKGDMSLVGPRPLLPEYLPLYTKEQNRRHEVKSGITGWAQVNGRNAITWEKKFELDVWYVDHQSFWLDLKILFITIFKVFKRDGISQNGHATMEVFRGTDRS